MPCRQALQARRKKLGPLHPNTLDSWSNLAVRCWLPSSQRSIPSIKGRAVHIACCGFVAPSLDPSAFAVKARLTSSDRHGMQCSLTHGGPEVEKFLLLALTSAELPMTCSPGIPGSPVNTRSGAACGRSASAAAAGSAEGSAGSFSRKDTAYSVAACHLAASAQRASQFEFTCTSAHLHNCRPGA